MKQVASGGRGAERLGLGRAFEEVPLVLRGTIGTQILRPFRAAKRAAPFSTFTREGILRPRDVRRGSGSAFSRDTFDVDELTYSCKGYGHEQPVDAVQREIYVNDFDADQAAQSLVRRILATEREKRVAAKIFDPTTNWPSGTSALCTDVSTDWDNAAATIVTDILAAREKVIANCGAPPNLLVLSAAHIPNLVNNTDLKGRIQYVNVPTAAQTIQQLAAITMIPNILFGSAIKGTHKEGATLGTEYVWSDDYAWMGVVAETDDLAEPCVGRLMLWDPMAGADEDAILWQMYEEPQTKSTVWQGEHWMDEKVFDPYFGHLLIIDT